MGFAIFLITVLVLLYLFVPSDTREILFGEDAGNMGLIMLLIVIILILILVG